ncbi:hypothetical protein [Neobacillus citreus]|uniref:Uncharacterized protein n=1 Tax=Neobacillus citreus TaxID=2833578 RepID=A0A942YF05_9BACI|nr:hypothetical protein [Neobacillus citreus]MCH6266998.1 hypothetical protein [Neobacillus citreus]
MRQTNSIWIVENRRQLESLQTLRPKLLYKEAVLEEECQIQSLPDYDMVFFLLTPKQIGNKFFIQAIGEVLRVRRNSKTIFLAIDDHYRLDDQESYKVILELKDSIKELIPNPTILSVSSYYAALHSQYKHGEINLEDLRQNREIMIPTADGELLTGRQITEENLEQLELLSQMEKLYHLIADLSAGIRVTGIDVSKENWLILGQGRTGKSMVSELLQQSLGESLHFIEKTPEVIDLDQYYDGMIVVVDLEIHNSLPFLEKIYSTYVGIEKIIVVNKMDDFMFYQKSQQELQIDIKKKIKSLTSDPVFFVSGLYYKQYLQLKRKEIEISDIIENPSIVLVDSLNLPVSKQKDKANLPGLLLKQSGFDHLLHHWE